MLTQLCLTLCNLMDCNPQTPLSMGFSREEYWSGLPFSPPEDLPDPGIEPTSLVSPALAGGFSTTEPAAAAAAKSHQSCPTLQPHGLDLAHQAPLSMGFSREEYWSGLPFPSPGDLPNPGIKPTFLASPILVSLCHLS